MALSKTTQSLKLSLKEKLDLLPGVASICLAAFHSILTGLWRTEKQAASFFLHIGYAIFRKATVRLSPLQMQYVMPPSNKIYDLYIKKSRQLPQTVDLGHGALGHWVGDKNADNVLVWYHGGGFSLPSNMGYYSFFARVIEDMRKAGKSISVFCLTYTLAPHATYPTQLRQAVECLRHVIDRTSHAPSSVYIGGDSAGGNLTGGVLSHIAHPHPHISPLSISENLAGAIMIAPWTMLGTDFADQEIYSGGDLITEGVATPWAGAYLGAAERDYYTDLSTAPTEWYHDFKVDSVLITAGGNEILLPIIQDFAAKFQEGFSPVEFFVGARECHVAPIYNLYLGDQSETKQGKKVKEWLKESL